MTLAVAVPRPDRSRSSAPFRRHRRAPPGTPPPAHTRSPTRPSRDAEPPHQRITLDRLLSKLGIASRTAAQGWIRNGRVHVNAQIVRKPDTWVSWPGDPITLDGQPLQAAAKRVVLFYKPKGVVTTHRDERERRTIFDVLPSELRSLHAVGRLDQATSGLLILTNDSTLSNYLTDPVHALPRVYLVTVRGEMTEADAQQALDGIEDDGERLRCSRLLVQKHSGRESHLLMTLTEGKNREVRRLCLALGHEVTRLKRLQFGPFVLGDLSPGAWRDIPAAEARRLVMGVAERRGSARR